MKEKVNAAPPPKNLWERLLDVGIFSIGPFAVFAQGEHIRVYHMRMNHICHCSREASFHEMERLCSERGYTFNYLLSRSLPESFLPVNRTDGQDDLMKKRAEQPSHFSTHETLKISDTIQDGSRMFGKVLMEETTVNQKNG